MGSSSDILLGSSSGGIRYTKIQTKKENQRNKYQYFNYAAAFEIHIQGNRSVRIFHKKNGMGRIGFENAERISKKPGQKAGQGR